MEKCQNYQKMDKLKKKWLKLLKNWSEIEKK